MFVDHLAFWLSVFWAALYGLRHRWRRTHSGSFLPAPSSSTPSTSPELFRTRDVRVTLRNFHLNIQSTAWNTHHQYAVARLKRTGRWRGFMVSTYDAGSAFGILGMLGSILLLVWTTIGLAFSWYDYNWHNRNEVMVVHKRDAYAANDVSGISQSYPSAPLQLIIPGVTTPLHHLPILLVALLAAQVVHELGHALAAALEAVPLGSVGLGLTVILPSAFVALPAGETESLAPRPRARIISAGAFHNLALWVVLAGAASVHISDYVWPVLGYRDVSAYGRVVVGVDEDSPLFDHVPLGAVVYKVGDETLDRTEGALHSWDALLSAKPDGSASVLGWCSEEPWFAAHSTSCCTSSRPASASSEACFSNTADPRTERCLDPLRFLDSNANANGAAPIPRCTSPIDCGHGQVCIRPRGDQELLSLTMHIPPWLRTSAADLERKIVWQGDRAQILHEVHVGDWLPRSRILPLGLPVWWAILFMYMEMLTLSLYFFNLLPLPFLDGGQLLDVLLAWQMRPAADESADTMLLGELEGGGAGPRHQPVAHSMAAKARWRKGVHVAVGALLGVCTFFSLTNAIPRP
ncbi:peptidase family M50-domain-containing protein [Daedaleopsis nitida]|nr:peptidase family M50-domain-containing protein [Daedaleopsis nitida]